ncbi:hypothetical protein BDA99DRAFT_515763 [Phascolomyces articulosus]|uniref:Uncharacterized protein n=1 Tax=Phascolomyces articulosus TaxID=60185 RepID=A0AAD5JVX6_9FUNG|nr:hypothetical protein BDA99DRAFT_515763 [Phascolomyces articulosus]
MPPEKVKPSKNAKIMNDIDWCLENLIILNFKLYQQTFKFDSESDARRRYGDILASKKICGSGEWDRLIKEFNEYKRNNDYTLSEAKNRLKKQRELTDIELQVDASKTLIHYAQEEGRIVRRKRLSEEIGTVADNHEDDAHVESQTKKTRYIDLDKDDEENDESGLVGGVNNLALECDEEEEDVSGLFDDDNYLAPGSEDEPEPYYSSGEEDEPKSDLSIQCHGRRSGDYNLMVEGDDIDVKEEDLDVMLVPWIVGEINVIEKCEQYAARTLEQIESLKSMSDTRILALNRIFLFADDINKSVSAYFGSGKHEQIVDSLGIMDNLKTASDKVNAWCATCGLVRYSSWINVQRKTIGYLNEALASENEFDLVIANILHRLLPPFAINGTSNGIGEDSYVHIVLAPLLELTFDFERSMNHMWANVSLQENKNLKPDYALYVNGLSKRFVVLVAEFKPPGGKDRMESDLVKIGNEMRFMVNRLVKLGVESPVVGGILVNKNTLSTYKLEIRGAEVYCMVQLSSIKLFTNVLEFSLIPTITSYLHQLKDITKETAIKVQDIGRKVNDGDPQHSNIPRSWLHHETYTMERSSNSS